MTCVNGRMRIQAIIYDQKICTIVLIEKVWTGSFFREGDPGSISKIPEKKKVDAEALG